MSMTQQVCFQCSNKASSDGITSFNAIPHYYFAECYQTMQSAAAEPFDLVGKTIAQMAITTLQWCVDIKRGVGRCKRSMCYCSTELFTL